MAIKKEERTVLLRLRSGEKSIMKKRWVLITIVVVAAAILAWSLYQIDTRSTPDAAFSSILSSSAPEEVASASQGSRDDDIPVYTKNDVSFGSSSSSVSEPETITPDSLTGQAESWSNHLAIGDQEYEIRTETSASAYVRPVFPVTEYNEETHTLTTEQTGDDIGTLTVTYFASDTPFSSTMFDDLMKTQSQDAYRNEDISGVYNGQQAYGMRQLSGRVEEYNEYAPDNHNVYTQYALLAVPVSDQASLFMEIDQTTDSLDYMASTNLYNTILQNVRIG